MRQRLQIWVLVSASDPPITNIEDPDGVLRILVILISGTQNNDQSSPEIHQRKNKLDKTTGMYLPVIYEHFCTKRV